MGDLGVDAKWNISVVIPALNAENYLPVLIGKIEAQTLLPKEIIVVDSSPTGVLADVLRKWNGHIPIIHKKIGPAYPGQARNIGAELAKGDWISFIDCRTIPSYNWLETCASLVERTGAEFVDARFICDADTHFQQILRAATYGTSPTRTLAGSIVLKEAFQQSGGFQNVRAGEDIEWMHRMEALGFQVGKAISPTIRYNGLTESLSGTIQKWYVYSFTNASVQIRGDQKILYLLIFFSLAFAFIYNWNAVFTGWDATNILFVPNITKLYVVVVVVAYMVYRGIIRPLQVKVKLSFLLPWRWLKVGLVGLCIDIAKAPGLIFGATLMLKRIISDAVEIEPKKNHGFKPNL